MELNFCLMKFRKGFKEEVTIELGCGERLGVHTAERGRRVFQAKV